MAILSFLFRGRSTYGWKVTVARPRMDGVGPNFAVFGRRLCRYVAARLKYRSACYSRSKLQWSHGILRCLNGMDCFLLFPVVSVRLMMVSEHRWLTLYIYIYNYKETIAECVALLGEPEQAVHGTKERRAAPASSDMKGKRATM